MSFIMRTASHIDEAWNPMCLMPSRRSSAVMGRPRNLLKSSSSTFCEPAGISADWTRTASLACVGAWDSCDIIFRWRAGGTKYCGLKVLLSKLLCVPSSFRLSVGCNAKDEAKKDLDVR